MKIYPATVRKNLRRLPGNPKIKPGAPARRSEPWSARTRPCFGSTRHVASRKAVSCHRTPNSINQDQRRRILCGLPCVFAALRLCVKSGQLGREPCKPMSGKLMVATAPPNTRHVDHFTSLMAKSKPGRRQGLPIGFRSFLNPIQTSASQLGFFIGFFVDSIKS